MYYAKNYGIKVDFLVNKSFNKNHYTIQNVFKVFLLDEIQHIQKFAQL
jgi:hypothetical protein